MNPDKIRKLGWVLVIIGALLSAGMAIAFVSLTPTFLNPGKLIDGTKFTGTAQQGRLALTLFGVILAFGVMSVITGAFQIKSGKHNNFLRFTMLGLFVLIGLVVWQVINAFGG